MVDVVYVYKEHVYCLITLLFSHSGNFHSSTSHSSPDTLQQLASQILAAHELCHSLVTRQEEFQERVTKQLHDLQSTVSNLLAPSQPSATVTPHPIPDPVPVMNAHMSTPTPADSPTRSTLCESTHIIPVNSSPTSDAQSERRSECEFALPTSRILSIRSNSCSRENLASNLVRELFSKEDRMLSNVKGVHGKKKFDEKKMDYVQLQAFELFPLASTENVKKCWASCVRAIDSASRQLNRTARKLTMSKETTPTFLSP